MYSIVQCYYISNKKMQKMKFNKQVNPSNRMFPQAE